MVFDLTTEVGNLSGNMCSHAITVAVLMSNPKQSEAEIGGIICEDWFGMD